MRKKLFSILLALVAGFGLSWAATVTVTWNNNDITGSGNSFTKDGVTITVDYIDFGDKNFMGGGTFTTTLGNFTKIEVTAARCRLSGTGWIGSTWTGNASSVSFSGDIMGRGTGVTMVFTIEPPTVDVTGITLSETAASMTVGGEAVTLTATVAPDNATDKTVTWTSSDPTVATVADGVVTAVAAGTATITATATNGTPDDTTDDKTATCTITVTDPDQEAADDVVALFDALPAVDAVTLDNKEAIEAARAAYEALTADQKALVTAEELAKLTDAEAALAAAEKAAADQEAANAVVALFDALPAADAVTLDNKEAIEAARAAYEALTADKKALVTPEDLAKLTDAEAALAALIKEGIEDVQSDKVKSTKVIKNGQLLILRGDKNFNALGAEVK